MPNIQEGVGKSGRALGDFDVGAYTAFSVGPDLAKARKSAKIVAGFITMGSPPPVLERHGINPVQLRQSLMLLELGNGEMSVDSLTTT